MIIQLDKPILTISGEQAKFRQDQSSPIEPLIVKGVFLELLPYAQVKGQEIVQCWDLAIKIKNAKKEIELDEKEVGLLKRTVEQNSIGRDAMGKDINKFATFVVAQVLKELEAKV